MRSLFAFKSRITATASTSKKHLLQGPQQVSLECRNESVWSVENSHWNPPGPALVSLLNCRSSIRLKRYRCYGSAKAHYHSDRRRSPHRPAWAQTHGGGRTRRQDSG